MKTAIAIDSLLLRDDSIFLLELILNLFPHSEIYTIVHRPGSILGPIETRHIVSSFLTHKTKDASVLRKNFWLLPSAVKGLPLHTSIEKVIVISRGYIHGLNLPDHVEKYLYILEWDVVEQKNLGWQFLFTSYVNDWREKALRKFAKIAVSSETLKRRMELPNSVVIVPTFKTEDYTFVRDEDHHFIFTHHLVYTQGLLISEFRSLLSFLSEKNEMVRVLGPDAHLESVKKEFPEFEFGGDHCEATNAMYSHQAKVIWDLGHSFFPSKAFGALATGRPVVVRDDTIQREFLGQATYFLKNFSHSSLTEIYHQSESEYMSVDRKALRRLGLKWNERLFKSKMSKFLGKA
jgi:hypothetical protein